MILCCMRFYESMICMPPFFFYDFLDLYFALFFYAHLSFVCSLSSVGSTSCMCVLSFPVQCWSLSYGKQRRPYRLCVQTWLRQQVWRTFNFFCTGSHFVTALLLLFLLLLREFLLDDQQHTFNNWISSNFSESEVPSQERKNFKSSPEIQVWSLFIIENYCKCSHLLNCLLDGQDYCFYFIFPASGAHPITGEKSLKLSCEWIFIKKRVQTLVHHLLWWKRWSGKGFFYGCFLPRENKIFLSK